jgi:hypothetical protein
MTTPRERAAQTGDGGGAPTPRRTDILSPEILSKAGEKAVSGTTEVLGRYPNELYFGRSDNTGRTWRITPLLDERTREITVLTLTQRTGRSTRLSEVYQVFVEVGPDGKPFYRVNHTNYDNPQDTGCAGFPKLADELFLPARKASSTGENFDQPTPHEIEPDLHRQ